MTGRGSRVSRGTENDFSGPQLHHRGHEKTHSFPAGFLKASSEWNSAVREASGPAAGTRTHSRADCLEMQMVRCLKIRFCSLPLCFDII